MLFSRNVCAVLGHLAETLAGPLSQLILNDPTLDYFIAGLDVNTFAVPIIDVLYSLIALEKFAQTGMCLFDVFGCHVIIVLFMWQATTSSES